MIDKLLAAPSDREAAIELEKAVDEGAEPARVGEAFAAAAAQVRGGAEEGSDEDRRPRRRCSIAPRASSTPPPRTRTAPSRRTPRSSSSIPRTRSRSIALEEARKALGKYEELVEMLLEKSQAAPPGEDAAARSPRSVASTRTSSTIPSRPSSRSRRRSARSRRTTSTPPRSSASCGATEAATWQRDARDDHRGHQGRRCSSPTDHAALLVRAARWYDTRARPRRHGARRLSAGASRRSGERGRRRGHGRRSTAARSSGRSSSPCSWPAPTPRRPRPRRAISAPRRPSSSRRASTTSARARDLFAPILADDPGHAKAGDAHGAHRRAHRGLPDARADPRAPRRGAPRPREGRGARARSPRSTRITSTISRRRRAASRRSSRSTREPRRAQGPRPHLQPQRPVPRAARGPASARVEVAATPRQKINLYERIAGLHDEEFLDHAQGRRGARGHPRASTARTTARSRRSRATTARSTSGSRVVALYEQARAASPGTRRARSSCSSPKARTLAEQVGSPERATQGLRADPRRAADPRRRARGARAPPRDERRRARRALRHRGARGEGGDARGEGRAVDARRSSPRDARRQGRRDRALQDGARREPQGHVGEHRAPQGVRPSRRLAQRRRRSSSASSRTPRAISRRRALHAELAKVYHSQLVDPDEGRGGREEVDRARLRRTPTGSWSSAISRSRRGRCIEATKHYESLVGRTGVLPKDDAVRVLVRFIEAFGKTQPKPSQPANSTTNLGDGAPLEPDDAGRCAVGPRARRASRWRRPAWAACRRLRSRTRACSRRSTLSRRSRRKTSRRSRARPTRSSSSAIRRARIACTRTC